MPTVPPRTPFRPRASSPNGNSANTCEIVGGRSPAPPEGPSAPPPDPHAFRLNSPLPGPAPWGEGANSIDAQSANPPAAPAPPPPPPTATPAPTHTHKPGIKEGKWIPPVPTPPCTHARAHADTHTRTACSFSHPPNNEMCADPVAITSNIAPHVHCTNSKAYFSYRYGGSSRVIWPGKPQPLPPCAGRASRSLAPYPP